MKYINLTGSLLLTAAVLAACGSQSAELQTEAQPVTAPVINNTTTTIPENNSATTTQNNAATSARPIAPIINTKQQPASTTASTATGLNPAHGQPGHRCEIAVGAPLNSVPTTPQQPAITTTAKPTTVATPVVSQVNPVQPAVTTTATGLNPEHGKPGHRCDISVGAPLNSKPAQQPTIVQQPVVNTTPQKTYIPEAQKITPPTITTAPTVVAEGMNPEHGKPGHRCDIAVGAPLNSKPKQ